MKSKTILLPLLSLFLSMSANANTDIGTGFVGNGYYRVHNFATGRYIYVTDNKDFYNENRDTWDLQAFQLWKDINHAISDPASVIFIQQESSGFFDFIAQSTSLHSLIDLDWNFSSAQTDDGSYNIYATKNGITTYLSDDRTNNSDRGKIGTRLTGDYRKWIADKIETNSASNYFGIKPTISLNGKYYQPFFAAFPFKAASPNMHVYYISKVVGSEAIMKEIVGEVPASTPVIVECASENPSDNRLEPLNSSSAKVTGNKLTGVYFCNPDRPAASTDAYKPFDASTMRVLTAANGKLVMTNNAPERLSVIYVFDENEETETPTACIPSNTCYLKADASTPAILSISIESGTTTGLEINETNFPDENFRNWLLEQSYGTDGVLTNEDIEEVKSLNVRNKGIQSLKGIENFTALTRLNCGNNQMAMIDVSKNTALEELWCDSNQLAVLDISENTKLIRLSCHHNQLTALDVSKNTELTGLFCGANQLIALDISKCMMLSDLRCQENYLTFLDVSKNSALTYISCCDNYLTELNVSACQALTTLYCYRNRLTALNISKCTMLSDIRCQENCLTFLDVSKNPALTYISCRDNYLTELNVSVCQALTTLYCYRNRLTALDVTGCTELTNLRCQINQLAALNLSKNTKLKYVNASYNHLEECMLLLGTNVTTVDLSYQTLDWTWNFVLDDTQDNMQKLPSILRYDYMKADGLATTQRFICTRGDWSLSIDYSNGQSSVTAPVGCTYKEVNGVLMDATLTTSAAIGSTFKMQFNFLDGDANFSGSADVLDLQTILNYMFNDWQSKAFNFTASNLYNDDIINVQDVVLMVDKLLSAGQANNKRKSERVHAYEEETTDAYLYWRGNELVLNTSTGVTAADIHLAGNASITWNLQPLGFTVTEKKDAEGTHAIIYSLSDAEIPVGETVIAHRDGGSAEPVSAMLSDRQAAPISVSMTASDATTISKIMAVSGDWSILRTDGTVVAQGTGNTQLMSARKHLSPGVYILQRENNNIQKFTVK